MYCAAPVQSIPVDTPSCAEPMLAALAPGWAQVPGPAARSAPTPSLQDRVGSGIKRQSLTTNSDTLIKGHHWLCSKPAANPQQTRRKPAASLQQTSGTAVVSWSPPYPPLRHCSVVSGYSWSTHLPSHPAEQVRGEKGEPPAPYLPEGRGLPCVMPSSPGPVGFTLKHNLCSFVA